jgi:hypothetical protein
VTAGRHVGGPSRTVPGLPRRIALLLGSAYEDPAPDLGKPGVQLCRFRQVTAQGAVEPVAPDGTTAAHTAAADASERFQAARLKTVIVCAGEVVRDAGQGELSPRHLVLEGAVDSPDRLTRETGRAADALRAGSVDAVLAVPM